MKVLSLIALGLILVSSAMADSASTVRQVLTNAGTQQHIGTYAKSGDWCAFTVSDEQLGQFADLAVTFQHGINAYTTNYTGPSDTKWSIDQTKGSSKRFFRTQI